MVSEFFEKKKILDKIEKIDNKNKLAKFKEDYQKYNEFKEDGNSFYRAIFIGYLI